MLVPKMGISVHMGHFPALTMLLHMIKLELGHAGVLQHVDLQACMVSSVIDCMLAYMHGTMTSGSSH